LVTIYGEFCGDGVKNCSVHFMLTGKNINDPDVLSVIINQYVFNSFQILNFGCQKVVKRFKGLVPFII
jgi:hypothetical protein